MFSLTVCDLVVLAAGTSFLEEALRARPILFLLYWFGCAWLTLTVILLALYDLLAVRRFAKTERGRLKRELLDEIDTNEEKKADDPDAGTA